MVMVDVLIEKVGAYLGDSLWKQLCYTGPCSFVVPLRRWFVAFG